MPSHFYSETVPFWKITTSHDYKKYETQRFRKYETVPKRLYLRVFGEENFVYLQHISEGLGYSNVGF